MFYSIVMTTDRHSELRNVLLIFKKGCVLQCIAVTNKELYQICTQNKNIPFYSICKYTATFLLKM